MKTFLGQHSLKNIGPEMWSNNQFVIFYVITFPLAAFILFLDLSHKKA